MAIDSKRDSTAMKIIATLTMLFLPGTFVAVGPFPFSPFSSSPHNPPFLFSHLLTNPSLRLIIILDLLQHGVF